MFRRVALATALLLLAATAPASAGSDVTIVDFDFVNHSFTEALGGSVSWHNDGAHTHSSTGNAPLKLWTFDVSPGADHSRTFRQAGAFAYHCRIHGSMKATVRVRMHAFSDAVEQNQADIIDAATVPAAGGFRYVIQRKAPGGSFQTWKTQSGKSATFKSSVTGAWAFRSRLKRLSDGAHTGWSPTLTIQVLHP